MIEYMYFRVRYAGNNDEVVGQILNFNPQSEQLNLPSFTFYFPSLEKRL